MDLPSWSKSRNVFPFLRDPLHPHSLYLWVDGGDFSRFVRPIFSYSIHLGVFCSLARNTNALLPALCSNVHSVFGFSFPLPAGIRFADKVFKWLLAPDRRISLTVVVRKWRSTEQTTRQNRREHTDWKWLTVPIRENIVGIWTEE